MRVNIITQPLYANYGGILQNFALQTALKRLGHEPLTLNTPPPRPEWRGAGLAIERAKRAVKKLIGRYDGCINPYAQFDREWRRAEPQRRFCERHINYVTLRPPFGPDVAATHPAEAYIVGSDQVWRPWCAFHMENNFLDFVTGGEKRLAYAASLGTDRWEIDPVTTERLRPLAARFDAISVREQSGVTLVRDHLGAAAERMPDPTMLLTAGDYMDVAGNSEDTGPYIGAYVLDMNPRARRMLDTLGERTGLPVRFTGIIRDGMCDSVEHWLRTIAGAEYVVTDSFHGSVFSMIFNRRFAALGNPVRGNSRFDSLFDTYGLRDRLMPPCAESALRLAESPVDYTGVNAALEAERARGYSFLKKYLI